MSAISSNVFASASARRASSSRTRAIGFSGAGRRDATMTAFGALTPHTPSAGPPRRAAAAPEASAAGTDRLPRAHALDEHAHDHLRGGGEAARRLGLQMVADMLAEPHHHSGDIGAIAPIRDGVDKLLRQLESVIVRVKF